MLSSPTILRCQRSLSVPSVKRAVSTRHDLLTIPNTQKPIISNGPPGYSAVSGHVVTVFGCTGFLGRYLVSKLAKRGTQVIVPYREEDEKRHLKLMGDLGQIVPLEWDIRNEQQINECLRHSDTVFNLVGREYRTKNFDFNAVHTEGAGRVARVAAASGVSRLVHVSHLNAAHDSPSAFYRSKAEGEDRVLEAFPDATIVRPSTMFGYEDRLLNNMAVWPIWWKLNHGRTKVRPVHVMDVAQALANLTFMPSNPSLLTLPGPSTLTYAYLLALVQHLACTPPSRAPVVPKRVAMLAARVAQAVWWPALSPDEVVRRYIDDKEDSGEESWNAVGIVPEEIEGLAIRYVRRYRAAADYGRPVEFPSREEYIGELVG